ncbi:ABC transporter ATP-binding protein [Oceanithermus sp.]
MYEDEAFKKSFDPKLARRILRYTYPYWKVILIALVALFVTTLTANVFPLILKFAIDRAIVPVQATELAARYHYLLLASIFFIVVRLFDFVARYVQTYSLAWLGQHVLFDMRSDIFRKIQRLHLAYFDRTPVGRLLTRITSDVDAINQFITGGLVGFLADFFMLVGIMGFMLYLNWRMALLTFAVMPVLLWTTTRIRTGMRDAYRVMRIKLARVNASLQENLSGVETIQLFAQEERQERRFEAVNRELRDAWVLVIWWFSMFYPIVSFLGEATVAAVIWYGGGAVIQGAVTFGLLVAFIDYVRNFFKPLQDMSDKFNIFQAAMASAERIFKLLDTPEEITDKPGALPVERFEGDLRFDHVWFAYKPAGEEVADDDWVLRDVDFHVRPGEKVALVGATGAGKTSTVSLIARFYDVQKGRVMIDGHDVRDYRQRDLRRAIGIVLQDPFLFSGTIEFNLRLGDESIPAERIVEVCRFVGAHEFIEKLPQGYQTVLGERGAGLSTGQKQLIALARAVLHNPDILLILDEATASVDSETERQIQRAMERVMEGRTSIIIAHRLSTIQNVDRILVFRKGRIVEEGSHAELLAAGGYYAKLYELQYAGSQVG